MNKLRAFFILFLALIAFASCGGGGSTSTASDPAGAGDGGGDSGGSTDSDTAPTVSSVTKGSTALASTYSGSRLTGVQDSSVVTITFSEAMNPATITNITYDCSGDSVGYTAATSDNIVWTFTPDGDLIGYATCTITVGVDVTDAGGTAIATAAEYQFTTQCSADDTFLVDTLDFAADNSETAGLCWTYGASPQGNYSSAFTVTSGVMRYDSSKTSGVNLVGANQHRIYKTFTASTFTATLELRSGEASNGRCELVAISENGQVWTAVYRVGSTCYLDLEHVQQDSQGSCATTQTSNNPLFLQMSWNTSTNTITGKFRYGSTGDFTTIDSDTTSDLGSSYTVGIACESNSSSWTQDIGSFTIDATPTGPGTQY